ncbi:hypothetical protein J3459_013570 [Metarhizium acridum]|nr:hypothetical protein J3459_013570 [Metarhizium acridum]
MAVRKLVHGQFCILQSDFERFGPSLPHSTLIAIMKYFRFPSEPVNFVDKFLGMRMKFEEDGEGGPMLTRKTGIPVSFQLTEGISESLLLTVDFAVNQRTGGAFCAATTTIFGSGASQTSVPSPGRQFVTLQASWAA